MSQDKEKCCNKCFDEGVSQLSYGGCSDSKCECHKEKKCEFNCSCHKGMLGSEVYGDSCGWCGCSTPPQESEDSRIDSLTEKVRELTKNIQEQVTETQKESLGDLIINWLEKAYTQGYQKGEENYIQLLRHYGYGDIVQKLEVEVNQNKAQFEIAKKLNK